LILGKVKNAGHKVAVRGKRREAGVMVRPSSLTNAFQFSIRLDRKLTQEEFADLVGVGVDFLSLIERGINSPNFEVLHRMGEG
jgi:DNA-binding XRE family transcriptional regulator